MRKFSVSKKESGLKVFDFLKMKLQGQISNRKIKEAIDLGGCLINNKIERFGNVSVKAGDIVELRLRRKKKLSFESKRILFESEDFLAYDKPAGLICDQNGLALLRDYDENLSFAHRLDQYTTGVLLLARNEKAKKHLEGLFRKREVEKTYLALVVGKVEKPSGVVKNRLGKIKEGVWGEVKGGKEAETLWKVLEQGDAAALVECQPTTGRTHQIRVHMAGVGHPILGDDRYGQNQPLVYHPEHYILHAYKLKFQDTKIIAPLPEYFVESCKSLVKELPQEFL